MLCVSELKPESNPAASHLHSSSYCLSEVMLMVSGQNLHLVNTSMTLEWPGCRSRNQSGDGEPWMLPVPVHIVTNSAQLPVAFLQPNADQSLVIGFDCEGVDLARYGRLCIMQVCPPPTSPLMLYAFEVPPLSVCCPNLQFVKLFATLHGPSSF